MKSGTKNLFIGLGIAAGAFLTVRALVSKPGKKIKNMVAEKLTSTKKSKNQDELYL